MHIQSTLFDIHQSISECQKDFSKVPLDKLQEKAWSIGKSLCSLETSIQGSSNPEFRNRYDLLTDDLQTLTTRISIAMRKQGMKGLSVTDAKPVLKWQILVDRMVGSQARAMVVAAPKKKKALSQLHALGERVQDRALKEARTMFIEAVKKDGARGSKRDLKPQKVWWDTLGSQWLKEKSRPPQPPPGRVFLSSSERDSPEYWCDRTINNLCRSTGKWEIAPLFPDRKIRASDVHALSIADIFDSDPHDFYAMVDLFSPAQAMEILRTESVEIEPRWGNDSPKKKGMHENRKWNLFVFNPGLAKTFSKEQRALYSVPVEERVQQAADAAWKKFKKYSKSEYRTLEAHPSFAKLQAVRITPSKTLTGSSDFSMNSVNKQYFVDRWTEFDQRIMAKGLQQKVTPEFLVSLNSALRKAPDNIPFRYREKFQEGPLGLREAPAEIILDDKGIYYLPQRAVKKEINVFCDWLNEEITACDNGEKNPIIVATSACQRLVSIHPFYNGNGRTSRLLADLILRRYGLLPAAWKIEKLPVFPIQNDEPIVTPTVAVERMLEGLENSYSIVN